MISVPNDIAMMMVLISAANTHQYQYKYLVPAKKNVKECFIYVSAGIAVTS